MELQPRSSADGRFAATGRPTEPPTHPHPAQFTSVPEGSSECPFGFRSSSSSLKEHVSELKKVLPAGLRGVFCLPPPKRLQLPSSSLLFHLRLPDIHGKVPLSSRSWKHQPVKNPLKSIFSRLIRSRLPLLGGEQPAQAAARECDIREDCAERRGSSRWQITA